MYRLLGQGRRRDQGGHRFPRLGCHLRALAGALHERRTTLLTAVGGALPGLLPPRPSRGGCHLWLRLPDGTDERAVTTTALRHGVAVTTGGPPPVMPDATPAGRW